MHEVYDVNLLLITHLALEVLHTIELETDPTELRTPHVVSLAVC